jgi:hypothetical protein
VTAAAALWRKPLPAADRWIERRLSGLPDRGGPVSVFFRADDVGAPGGALERLLGIFEGHGAPLALAVVPAWLTRERWAWIGRRCRAGSPLWCWHQHGWRHVNHETTGRKQEFGPSRPGRALAADVLSGRRRLERIMGGAFSPFFTPPWNRCTEAALRVLAEADFLGVSRTRGAEPHFSGLPELGVSVDLHTRREPGFDEGWRGLAASFSEGLSESPCGIMIHHRRMNGHAFAFLESLVAALKAHPAVRLVGMADLAPGAADRK